MKRFVVVMIAALVLPLQLFLAGPVHAQTPALTLSPTSVAPGGTVAVTGTGFDNYESAGVTMHVEDSSGTDVSWVTPTSVPVNSSGQLFWNFTVPSGTAAGSYSVVATDPTTSTDITSQPLTVSGQSGPSLTISPGTVTPGSSITITGSGLTSGATVNVYIPYTTTGGSSTSFSKQETITSTGTLPQVTFTTPSNIASGTYTVYVYSGSATSGTALATKTFTVSGSAAITLNPTSVQAGSATSVTVSGTAFGASEKVNISYTAHLSDGTNPTESTSATTDASGNFTASTSNSDALPVPANILPGAYVVTALGATSGRTATATLTVTSQPSITLSQSTAAPGQTISVTGQGFLPNQTVTINQQFTTVSDSTLTQTASATAGSNGTFSSSIAVPSGVTGSATITATQSQSGTTVATATATLHIQSYQPTITASPQTVAPGGTVTITGAGFAPGPGALVNVSFTVNLTGGGTQQLTGNFDTSSSGNFSGQFIIPSNAATSAVTVTANQTLFGVSASGVFAIAAQATATPTPTNTPTPSPTPTNTPTPTATSIPVVTPTPQRRAGALHFKKLTLWYHVAEIGTFNHVDVQASPKMRLGIWVHVVYPTGITFAFYQNTDSKGHWAKTFSVPLNAISRYSNRAWVILQLWRGKTSLKDFVPFTVIR